MKENEIIFDAERMRYPNTGLYHYCLQLGKELLSIAKSENKGDSFKIYSSDKVLDFNHNIVKFSSFHKFIFPTLPKGTIWHCNYQLSSYIPKSRNVKKVLTVHDLNFLREKSVLKQGKYLNKVQKNIDRSDVIVCISKFVRDELLHNCNVNNKRVEVIYNGNNINNEVKSKALVRDRLDLSKPFLFTVGVVLPKKNFISLVYLLVNNDLNLVISGILSDPNYQSEIMNLADSLGVSDRVFLTGAISEEEKYYMLQHCHVFCFPSFTEGFGLPVVEAMHFGCNILLSPNTCLPEIGGDVVKYFDTFESDYLMKLSSEISSWNITEEERERVKSRSKLFSWETAAKAYWEIYLSLS